jgi:hypothetical protein
MAESVARQVGEVAGEAGGGCRHSIVGSGGTPEFFGQNQIASAMALGTVPAAAALAIWFWPKNPDVPPEPTIE